MIPGSETFHSFSAWLPAARLLALGCRAISKFMTRMTKTAVVKLALEHINIKDPGEKIRGLLERISFARKSRAYAGPSRRRSRQAQRPLGITASKVYEAYEKILRKAGALDFDDLLLRAVQVLSEFPEARANWQRRFRYIHVDEYQDTNRVQYDLLRLLVGESRNLCVVGDEDQSIYRWRGADMATFFALTKIIRGRASCAWKKITARHRKFWTPPQASFPTTSRRLGKRSRPRVRREIFWRFLKGVTRRRKRNMWPTRFAFCTAKTRPCMSRFCIAPTRNHVRLKKPCAHAACAIACWAAFRFTSAPK